MPVRRVALGATGLAGLRRPTGSKQGPPGWVGAAEPARRDGTRRRPGSTPPSGGLSRRVVSGSTGRCRSARGALPGGASRRGGVGVGVVRVGPRPPGGRSAIRGVVGVGPDPFRGLNGLLWGLPGRRPGPKRPDSGSEAHRGCFSRRPSGRAATGFAGRDRLPARGRDRPRRARRHAVADAVRPRAVGGGGIVIAL